jgi:hypothetical protein
MKLYDENFNLTKEAKKQCATVQITKSIPYQELEYIVTGALEGGINYWAGLDNSLPEWENEPEEIPSSQYAFQLLVEGKSVKFYDIEKSDDDSDWILTMDKLIKGIQKDFEERPEDIDLDSTDAITYDCIIQYALFGELVYG